jgi:acyl dehydratase
LDLDKLPIGHSLPATERKVTQQMVLTYLNAVGDHSPVYESGEWVPPTALSALTVRFMLETMGLPPGTLHASQEIKICRPVTTNSKILYEVKVAQNTIRQPWRFLVLDVMAREKGGPTLMLSRCTLLVPMVNNQ